MSLMHLNFESKYLRSNTDVSVVLPDRPHLTDPMEYYSNSRRYKTLWLLHGTYGDHSDWLRHTNIELYASERDCIVVMPSGINTYFMNWPGFGPGYYVEDFLIKELMPLIHGWFPASAAREDNYAAGLSMGAVAALNLITRYPDLFSGGAMLSAFPSSPKAMRIKAEEALCQDYEKLMRQSRGYLTPFDPAFQAFRMTNNVKNCGTVEDFIGSNDSWNRLKTFSGSKNAPSLYFACGTEDPNYPSFQRLREYAGEIGLDAVFEECPGAHEWRFWDAHIEKAMDFLNICPVFDKGL